MNKTNEEVVNYLLDSYNEATEPTEKDYYLKELERFKEETNNFTETLTSNGDNNHIRNDSTQETSRNNPFSIVEVPNGSTLDSIELHKPLKPHPPSTEYIYKKKDGYEELTLDEYKEVLRQNRCESEGGIDSASFEDDNYESFEDDDLEWL